MIPHPFSFLTRSIGQRTLERTLKLPPEQRPDGIEIASPLAKGWHAGEHARRANLERWGLAETGGSDSHFAETLGLAYTRYRGRTSEALRAAIEARTTEGVLQGSTPYREIGLGRLAAQQVRGLSITPRKVLGPKVGALRDRISARIAAQR